MAECAHAEALRRFGVHSLLTPFGSVAKTVGDATTVEGAILHLAPSDYGERGRSVCPWATEGCRAACLATSGRGQFRGRISRAALLRHPIHRARVARTRLFWRDRPLFLECLVEELRRLSTRAERRGVPAVARLNGTSDIPWETVLRKGLEIIGTAVQFFDYTKSVRRMGRFLRGDMPTGYHLTFSLPHRSRVDDARRILDAGGTVAVVFRPSIPDRWEGFPVVDGTGSDLRYLDPPATIVGLLPKGRAKRDRSGFVVDV